MNNHTGKRIAGRIILILLLICSLCMSVCAQTLPCESATATAHYRHPQTGAIEDSGGESSEALAQGMVESVVDKQALVEANSDGTYYLSLRFHLMNNISQMGFSVQNPGESTWQQVTFENTAAGDDVGDVRLQIPGKDSIVRVECMVDVMGRKVVFFVTLDQFVEGNLGGFTQTEQIVEPAAQPETVPEQTQKAPEPPQNGSEQVGKEPSWNDTVGLVIGGTGKAPETGKSQEESQEVQEVAITTNVWIMFFCLVFCAQLLACLAFWGIKTLVCNAMGKKKQQATIAAQFAEEPEEEADFSDELWKDDWEESGDEQK